MVVNRINDDGCWNAGKMANQTESHWLFNNASPADIALFIFDNSLGHACKAKEAVRCTARNRDGVEQRMVFLDGVKNWDTDILESLLWYISNKAMKRLRGNVHFCSMVGSSWTERLTKQCIRVKKVESDFEEREQYKPIFSKSCSRMVRSSGCRSVLRS